MKGTVTGIRKGQCGYPVAVVILEDGREVEVSADDHFYPLSMDDIGTKLEVREGWIIVQVLSYPNVIVWPPEDVLKEAMEHGGDW